MHSNKRCQMKSLVCSASPTIPSGLVRVVAFTVAVSTGHNTVPLLDPAVVLSAVQSLKLAFEFHRPVKYAYFISKTKKNNP
jgi:hypothetical protein